MTVFVAGAVTSASAFDWQLLVVAAIIAVCVVWIIYKIVKRVRHRDDPCCGCSLSSSCRKVPGHTDGGNGTSNTCCNGTAESEVKSCSKKDRD